MNKNKLNFQRARSDEQKKLRMHQIMDATLKLYETQPFQKISLSNIAKELNFTRANLYKYVSTKEEIFLNIILREGESLSKNLETAFEGKENISLEEFATIWATVFYGNSRFIQLMAIMYSIIEKNVTLEYLIDFKKQFSEKMFILSFMMQKSLPKISEEVITQFLMMQMFYAMGLFPATNDNELQKEAIKVSGIPYKTPNFIEEFSKFIILTIKGLST